MGEWIFGKAVMAFYLVDEWMDGLMDGRKVWKVWKVREEGRE